MIDIDTQSSSEDDNDLRIVISELVWLVCGGMVGGIIGKVAFETPQSMDMTLPAVMIICAVVTAGMAKYTRLKLEK
jgi:prolipoprotein diacylglyceryltransferase